MSVIAVQSRAGRVRSLGRTDRPRVGHRRQFIGPKASPAGQPRPLARPVQPDAPSGSFVPFVVGVSPAARSMAPRAGVSGGEVVASAGWTLTDRGRLVILTAFAVMVLLAVAVVIGQFLAVSADPLNVSAAALVVAVPGASGA